MDFKSLKKNRKNALNKLQEQLNTQAGKKEFKADERFWQPSVDKHGNGHAVIRFLPPKDGDVPYVRLFSHAFKGPTGQWYIENSRSTLGEPDPVGELNSKLWNSGQENEARKQKRKLTFISNVLIVKDRVNPENEGTVRLFKYGKKLFEKVAEAATPPFDEEGRAPDNPDYNPTNAFDPFDMWDSANFTIRIRQVDGYRNYDKSDFGERHPVDASEDTMKEIFDQTYNINELVEDSPKNFKSYDELKARLNRVLGLQEDPRRELDTAPERSQRTANPPQNRSVLTDDDDDDDGDDLAKLLADLNDE